MKHSYKIGRYGCTPHALEMFVNSIKTLLLSKYSKTSELKNIFVYELYLNGYIEMESNNVQTCTLTFHISIEKK